MKWKIAVFVVLGFIAGCSVNSYLPDIESSDIAYQPVVIDTFDTNVHAVVQSYDIRFEVTDPGHAIKKVQKVTTILDREGSGKGQLVLGYDQFRSITDIKGALYDAEGELIRTLTEYDQADFSATSSFTLYDDSRVKTFSLQHNNYPYTVVYSYIVKYDGLISWPTWVPIQREEYVQHSSFEIEAPKILDVRYYSQNLSIIPKKETDNDKGSITYRWEVSNVPPLNIEYYGPSIGEQYHWVEAAPDRFEIAGTSGDMASWKEFGKWYAGLAANRDQLPVEAQKEIAAILDGLNSKRDSVKAIYNYLQDETRYVSVQLGIGGWQPFDAEYVFENKYGDCKALTNFMKAMLSHVGIESHPVLIRSGSRALPVIPEFSSNQFNHVILMVPMQQDTLWLECTSKVHPFGYIGTSNANKNVLVVKPDGGELVKTPSYDVDDNLLEHQVDVTLDKNGKAEIDVRIGLFGNYMDNSIGLAYGSPKERRKWLREGIYLPEFALQYADFSSIDRKENPQYVDYAVTSEHYGTFSGSRFFIPLNRLNKWHLRLPQNEERTQPVDLKYARHRFDKITLHLPDDLNFEAIPESTADSLAYGRFSYSIDQLNDSTIYIERDLQIFDPEIPSEGYNELRNFFERIVELDQQTIVVKTE